MYYYPEERWYALRVRHRHEIVTEQCLARKQFEPLVLTYQERSRRKDRKRILTKFFFPGYMFIRTEMNAERHIDILNSSGVVEVLRNSQGPIPIEESQIDNIQKLKEYTGKILTFNEYLTGMKVKIVQGPLAGLIGRIDEVQRNLLKVSIDSIPGSVAIQVNPSLLEPLETNCSLSDLLEMNAKAV